MHLKPNISKIKELVVDYNASNMAVETKKMQT